MARPGSRRRKFSVSKDIIQDVYEKFNGKYTEEQIEDVFNASLNYIYHLARFTDAIRINIPFVGYVEMNKDQMEKKYLRMSKYYGNQSEVWSKGRIAEFDALRKKIKDVSGIKGMYGDTLTMSYAKHRYYIKSGDRMEDIEDFQNSKYKENEGN